MGEHKRDRYRSWLPDNEGIEAVLKRMPYPNSPESIELRARVRAAFNGSQTAKTPAGQNVCNAGDLKK